MRPARRDGAEYMFDALRGFVEQSGEGGDGDAGATVTFTWFCRVGRAGRGDGIDGVGEFFREQTVDENQSVTLQTVDARRFDMRRGDLRGAGIAVGDGVPKRLHRERADGSVFPILVALARQADGFKPLQRGIALRLQPTGIPARQRAGRFQGATLFEVMRGRGVHDAASGASFSSAQP